LVTTGLYDSSLVETAGKPIRKKDESLGKIEHLLNKSKIIVETLGNFLQILTSKNNICHEHYYRGFSPYANFITARYLWLMRFLSNFVSLMHFFAIFGPKNAVML